MDYLAYIRAYREAFIEVQRRVALARTASDGVWVDLREVQAIVDEEFGKADMYDPAPLMRED